MARTREKNPCARHAPPQRAAPPAPRAPCPGTRTRPKD
jgi:hypothetical protein